jgi:hypothetical protein
MLGAFGEGLSPDISVGGWESLVTKINDSKRPRNSYIGKPI